MEEIKISIDIGFKNLLIYWSIVAVSIFIVIRLVQFVFNILKKRY